MSPHLKVRVRLCLGLSLDGLDELGGGLRQDSCLSNHLAGVVAGDELSGGGHYLLHDVGDLVGVAILDVVQQLV